jgi:hypothetical protein
MLDLERGPTQRLVGDKDVDDADDGVGYDEKQEGQEEEGRHA